MGPNCYVVVEDSQWNVNVNQAQVDTIIAHFEQHSIGPFAEQGIWDLDTTHFGDPPDNLDQDPRVYLLYYQFDVAADGFFWIFDQECDDVADYHSNECDVVYLNCGGPDPAGAYMLAVLAHEFEHLIHHNYDIDEVAWVDEGLAELAMWLYGNPDVVSSFNGNPDRDLTNFQGNWADYIKSYLFTLYFYERYGGQISIRALVADPFNSIAGYDRVLDTMGYVENFTDVFSDWVVANYLDDTTIGDGRFGYVGEELPPFVPAATWSSYPVGPVNASVQHWAADYVRYLEASGLHLSFNGSDTNRFAVRAMLLDDLSPTEVVDMPLNGTQDGSLFLPEVGSTHDEAVVVYASIQTTGTMTYTYGADSDVVGVPGATVAVEPRLVAFARDGWVLFRMHLPGAAAGTQASLDVFDLAGRHVRRVYAGAAGAGDRLVTWDGSSSGHGRVASGTYFARLTAGETQTTSRFVLVR
jgi:hypothetical protein